MEAIWEEIELETNEFLGWEFSQEILAKIHRDRAEVERGRTVYHVASPEIVRRHLEMVVKKTSQTEFILHRIVESDVYPSLQSAEIQATAALFRKRVLAEHGRSEALDLCSPDDIEVAAKFLRTVMQAKGLSLGDIAKQLDAQTDVVVPDTPLLGIC